MTGQQAARRTAQRQPRQPRHGLRILVGWLALSLVADLVIWFAWYPHMPPGDMTDSARHQQFDIGVLAVCGAPVVIGVLYYFLYAIVVWRARPGDDGDGPPIYGNTKIQVTWIAGTSAVVLFLAAFGTVELIGPAGAGAGEGPAPVWKLAGVRSAAWNPGRDDMLQVQVIGQQWTWTYRYPQFGGLESSTLYLPLDTPVTFHVTSLDVIHSFWAYQLGVKADANPGVDNVAYTTPKRLGGFTVRCNELCGIWHGAMYDYGKVVGQQDFQRWASAIAARERDNGLLTALPAYALTYDPTVLSQLTSSSNLSKVDGITGAAGYYYPSTDPEQP